MSQCAAYRVGTGRVRCILPAIGDRYCHVHRKLEDKMRCHICDKKHRPGMPEFMEDPISQGWICPKCAPTPSPDLPVVEDNWIHRSEGMRCRTCMYFVLKASSHPDGQSEIGRCRRHAPTMSGWPVMFVGDWCGDHKLDENL